MLTLPPRLLLMAAILSLPSISARSEENDAPQTDGPWISSVQWRGTSELVGTRSQGLLLRPGQLVQANAEQLDQLKTLGEAETSMWDVLVVGENQVVATDYKGGIHLFGQDEPTKLDCEARWIRALAAAPQAGQFLAGTEDGKLIVLSHADHQEVRRIDAHQAAIFCISVDGTGERIATTAGDGTIHVYSWPELKPLAKLQRRSEAVWSAAFSNTGRHLISGGADRRLQLWDLDSAQSICTIARSSDWITDLEILPESNVVVASCMDGSLLIADHQAMVPVKRISAAESAIWSIDLSSDGQHLALGTRKHGLQIVSTADWIQESNQAAAEAALVRPPTPNIE